MGNSKIIFGNETLIDLTSDTVSESNMLEGITAHNASGDLITGNVVLGQAASKNVDTSISKSSTSTNLPTSAAVASFVEGKGYTKNTGTVTSVAVKMNGVTKGTITSSGTIDLGTVLTSHQSLTGKQDKIIQNKVAIKTGSSSYKLKITLKTLMTWLITTKIIPSNKYCMITFRTDWSYAYNDILQIKSGGVNYELQLAGCEINFVGTATDYNTGEFILTIKTAPTSSFTLTSGYTDGKNSIFEYICNGTTYEPNWRKYNLGSESPSMRQMTTSEVAALF